MQVCLCAFSPVILGLCASVWASLCVLWREWMRRQQSSKPGGADTHDQWSMHSIYSFFPGCGGWVLGLADREMLSQSKKTSSNYSELIDQRIWSVLLMKGRESTKLRNIWISPQNNSHTVVDKWNVFSVMNIDGGVFRMRGQSVFSCGEVLFEFASPWVKSRKGSKTDTNLCWYFVTVNKFGYYISCWWTM